MFSFVILAGGHGSRMKVSTPKPLLKYNGKSLVEHALCSASNALPGSSVLVIVSDSSIAETVQSGLQYELLVNYYYNIPNLGIGGALAINKAQMHNPVVIMCSDVFLNINLNKYIKRHNKRKVLFTMLLRPQEFEGEGIVSGVNGDIITHFMEHADHKGMANSGIYICNPSIFGLYKGIDLVADIVPQLVKDGNIRGDSIDDDEYAIGVNTLAEYNLLCKRYSVDNS